MGAKLRHLVALVVGVGLAGVGFAASMALPAAAATRIGVAAATKNEVEGVQGGAARPLSPGSQVFALETVKTGAASAAQLIFLDETSLSIGPKAEITLDRFVFDPNRKTGDVVLSASRGAFRFITGSQDPRSYKIRTPVATIGVRGTILDCFIAASGLLCILQEGAAIVDVAGKIFNLSRPGQAIIVTAAGEVRGPFTPDGTFYDVAGIFPFPLYGGEFDAVIRHLEIGDGIVDLIDEVNALDAVPPDDGDDEPPPPPDDDDDTPPPDDTDDDVCNEHPDCF